ncbi:T9SS type A sorting domain-containing protein [Arundinibacter roseus]|uniref:T9SS type A sorting domain-containing protein n=1 Tax=Arundinibacter roseus TaxID=2070510 RepID=A0A4R4KKX6_9BACT|nr:T9SS type A sorting domain-containing protein [Arundinibacter roseus]TDB68954.1 T9SS type A sorting domain-containing protein [Arundinibacter roseus]
MKNLYKKIRKSALILGLAVLGLPFCVHAQRVYFEQDFLDEAEYASTTPTVQQFDTIRIAPPLTLTSGPGDGYLQFNRPSTSGEARIVRSTDIGVNLRSLYIEFTVNVPNNSGASNNAGLFSFGTNYSTTAVGATSPGNSFARFSIAFNGDNTYRIYDPRYFTTSANLSGPTAILLVTNGRDEPFPYLTPLGTYDTLALNSYSLWAGTELISENVRSNNDLPITDFDFRFGLGVGSIQFGPLRIREIEGILPVNLTYFRAQRLGEEVALEWETAWERNSKEFVVQRSTNLKEFGDIGKLAAAGETEGKTQYTFTDPSPALGTNYYRLRQVDKDNTYEYSKVVDVVNNPNAPQLLVSPNPIRNQVVRLRTFLLDDSSLQLVNLLGQTIPFDMKQTEPNTLELRPLSFMSPGLYIISTIKNGTRYSSQLVVPY